MLEPPSPALLESLREFRLCTRADLRRCRRRVRKLAHDLPAFDSVWIDALQQLRRITPFQAKMLQSSHPQQLAIGPCILLDQLGSSGESQTYLARTGEKSQQCVLKTSQLPAESREAALSRLQATIERLSDFHHRSLVAPYAALVHQERLVMTI